MYYVHFQRLFVQGEKAFANEPAARHPSADVGVGGYNELGKARLQRPHWEPRSKSDLRSQVIDGSKGSNLFSISRKGESPFRLCFAVGKRLVLLKWRHAEEWISLTTDTVEGFKVEADFHLHESPNLITILGSNDEKLRYCYKILPSFRD